jgi:transketolase
VSRALEAAGSLGDDGVSARVLAMPTIKPLDGPALLAAARETAGIVTVEEALTSGLGGAVAEYLAPRHPTRMRFVGVPDTFAPTGSVGWLMDHFGISPAGIAAAALEVVAAR